MNFKKNIMSVILAAVVVNSFNFGLLNSYALQCDSVQTESYDINHMKDAVEKFDEACSKPDNEQNVKKCFDDLMKEYDRYETALAVSKINYYEDESFLEDYQYEQKLSAEVKSIIYTCLSEQMESSEYKELITGLLGDEFAEYVKVSASVTDDGFLEKVADNENDYEEIVSDGEEGKKDEVPQRIKIADNYIEKMKMYKEKCGQLGVTPMEYFYQVYSRDYTNQEIKEISENIKDIFSVLEPLNDYYFDACIDTAGYNDIIDYFVDIPLVDPMDITAEYAPKLSDDLKESAEYLIDNHMYTITSKYVSKLSEGFTTVFPSENTPYIYIGCIKRLATNLGMCVHEYGHFNALYHTDCSNSLYKTQTNIDIAETQSQGLTLLYMNNFYDEIYGEETAKLIKQYELKDVIFKLSAGFCINEFENYVCDHAEEITAEELIEKYYSLLDEYGISSGLFPFDSNNVMLTKPGYSISYSISLLASLDLLRTDISDHEKAVEMYSSISRENIYTSSFKSSLQKCGFDDVLSDEFIVGLKDFLCEYMDDVQNLVCGDIDDDKEVSENDYNLLKKYLLLDGDVYDTNYYFDSVADLNRDSSVNVFDAIRLRKKAY